MPFSYIFEGKLTKRPTLVNFRELGSKSHKDVSTVLGGARGKSKNIQNCCCIRKEEVVKNLKRVKGF